MKSAAKLAPAKTVQAKTVQAKPKLNLRVLPVLKLGVDKATLVRGPEPVLCRATQGGSCFVDCTGTTG